MATPQATFVRRWVVLAVVVVGLAGVFWLYKRGVDQTAAQAAAVDQCHAARRQLHRLWSRYLTKLTTYYSRQSLVTRPSLLPSSSPTDAQERRLQEIEEHNREQQAVLDWLKQAKPPARERLRATDIATLRELIRVANNAVGPPRRDEIESIAHTLSQPICR